MSENQHPEDHRPAGPARRLRLKPAQDFGPAYRLQPRAGVPMAANGAWRVGTGIRGAVQTLDWALRERQGIFEYSRDPRCLLRISAGEVAREVAREVALVGARPVPAGARILDIHFWNEHMAIGGGPARLAGAEHSLRFAAAIRSRFVLSLSELADYLANHAELADVAAIRAKFAYPIHADPEIILDVMRRFGFAPEPAEIRPHLISSYLLVDLFLWALAWSCNARGVSGLASVRRRRRRFWMSRQTLDTRYGARLRRRPLRAAGD